MRCSAIGRRWPRVFHVTLWLLAAQGCATAPTTSASAEVEPAVRSQASAGPVRVLVELRLTGGFVPEGEMTGPSGTRRQREDIARLQQTLVARLAGTRFRVVRRFETVPWIALEIHADALAALEGMPDVVARVREDSLSAPSGGAGASPGGPAK
jgi:hypothetical protein